MAVYFIYLLYKAGRKKHKEFQLILLAMCVMLLAILKENLIGGVVSWIPYASLVFVFCFAYITLKHFLDLIKKTDALEEKVILDPLTKLFNRNYIKEIDFENFITEEHKLKYVMFLDLDDFKQINDTYGHKIGDYILRESGKRFQRVLNDGDIICRYGGDEAMYKAKAAGKNNYVVL